MEHNKSYIFHLKCQGRLFFQYSFLMIENNNRLNPSSLSFKEKYISQITSSFRLVQPYLKYYRLDLVLDIDTYVVIQLVRGGTRKINKSSWIRCNVQKNT